MGSFNPFRRTRAAAEHVLRLSADEQTHLRLLELLRALNACENAWVQRPAALQRRVSQVRAATRALLGPRWIAAHTGDPDIAALDALDAAATASGLDMILANALRRRFTAPTRKHSAAC